ncbi:thiamine diphosphokinase [Paenibacillus sp. HB172176]|uniref:thiamine diphosphokinase n=1 Tax=Paenibacillus sp. HB172176 TaxID=2493690 RepID=UPI0014397AB3
MHSRIVIVSGGHLDDWALEQFDSSDFIIAADRGADFLVRHGVNPDIAIGDFDSVSPEAFERIQACSGKTIACDPIDKNDTDTEMAMRLALDIHPGVILLLGATGTRFDHTLANVHLLALAADIGIEAILRDKHNEIRLVVDQCRMKAGPYTQVSLLPLSEKVTGISLIGFQYPLHDATLSIGQSLGISNVLLESEGFIQIAQGKLLVIASMD